MKVASTVLILAAVVVNSAEASEVSTNRRAQAKASKTAQVSDAIATKAFKRSKAAGPIVSNATKAAKLGKAEKTDSKAFKLGGANESKVSKAKGKASKAIFDAVPRPNPAPTTPTNKPTRDDDVPPGPVSTTPSPTEDETYGPTESFSTASPSSNVRFRFAANDCIFVE